jgi:hypothetical protein
MKRQPIYGLLAEFDNPESLVEAAHQTHAAGYKKIDAFTPMPVEGLADAIGFHGTRLPGLVFVGGFCGCVAAFAMQYYASVISLPVIVGGKPFNSWPAFVIICFEMTILGAALTCVFGMLALNGLPTPYHPVFNVERFALASRDRFFLCIKARDRHFDRVKTKEFLQGLHCQGVYEIDT